MKKNVLISILCLVAAIGFAQASGRLSSLVTLVGQDDGNTRAAIAVSCVSSSWTQVVASRENRRLLKIRVAESAGGTACIGTNDYGGAACASATIGTELGTGDEFSDSNEGSLYCRTVTGSGAGAVVKGFDEYDSKD